MVKNAYTFAKRAKELAKKKKKEEKQQRKTQRDGGEDDGQPIYDEATGQIVYPTAAETGTAQDDSDQPAS